MIIVHVQAAFGEYTTTIIIDVCPGQRIRVTQMYTKPEWEPAWFHLEQMMYYLDVEFDIGGCHNEFGGIVGQMYQCK